MKRRTFIETALALPALAQAQSAEPGPTRWQKSAAKKQEMAKGIVWPNHEDLAFLLRRGGNPEDVLEHYELMHDPENTRRMAAVGVRYARIHFYKGLGLAYESPEIERTKTAAALMHQLGMKVSLYMAGTMFVESFYREVPEAKDWEQRDQWGRWVPYTQTQTWRHYACPNEPAYREYLKRVLDIGVQEIKADQIIFDNVMLQPEPKSCHCPRCIRAFHDFLRAHYTTDDAAYRRFGFRDLEWIQVPEWDNPSTPEALTVLDDPVLQEWVRFRCESLAHHAADLHDHVKKLNPAVSVGFNIKGLYSFNRIWTNAVYHPLYTGHCDFFTFDTSGYNARIDPAAGALVSQIRSYKMARRLEMGTEEGLGDELQAAVHMAFNYERPISGFGVQGGPFMAYNIFTPFMEFFREYNDRYCTGTDNIADVAVLRNWPSMAYSISANWIPATLLEQVLIQYKVPFDLLHEEQIDRLDRYQAVILAAQDSIPDVQLQQLIQYVVNGGTLVVAGNSGENNGRRERRRRNPLLPARKEGKGRILHIPSVDTQSRSQRLDPPQWVLPKNHEEIYKTIAAGLPKGLAITTEAPLTTVMELYTRAETRETIVHFVNFDRSTPAAAFAASVRNQFPGAIKSVVCISPDADDPVELEFHEAKGTVFTVPATRLYSMIVIAHE